MRFKHIKRGISLLLVLAMVFSMLPMRMRLPMTTRCTQRLPLKRSCPCTCSFSMRRTGF